MSRLITIFTFLLTLTQLVSRGYGGEGYVYIDDHIILNIPQGMTIDNSSARPYSVAFMFNGDEDLIRGEISIVAKPYGGGSSLDAVWERVRPFFVRGMDIEYEREEHFAGSRWKIVSGSVVLAMFRVRNTLSYTIYDNSVQCIFQYNCPATNCFELEENYNEIKKTLNFR